MEGAVAWLHSSSAVAGAALELRTRSLPCSGSGEDTSSSLGTAPTLGTPHPWHSPTAGPAQRPHRRPLPPAQRPCMAARGLPGPGAATTIHSQD